jgi:hypothetical protein
VVDHFTDAIHEEGLGDGDGELGDKEQVEAVGK